MKFKLTNKPIVILTSLVVAITLFAGGYFWHSLVAAPPKQTANAEVKPAVKTGYVKVNGLNMYYEIHGSGKPLVLLHGGLSNIEVDFHNILPRLAKNRQVIAIEQQGHGRTTDIDRPLSYEQMADDTAAALRQLDITNADFLGYSMGGGIATQVAVRHPNLVRKLILMSSYYKSDGFYPQIFEIEKTMEAKDLEGSPFQKSYAKLAPKPEQWPGIVEKMRKHDTEDFKDWPPEMIASIKVPTFIIIGDSDIIRPEHAVEMFKLRGGGIPDDAPGESNETPDSQLAILPDTTHFNIVERDDWLLSMIPAFLDKAVKTE